MPWTFSSSRLCSLVAFVALGTGCAASAPSDVTTDGEADALVAPSVVVADSKATQSAEVLADSIRIPAAVAERYRALAPGSIFVAARGPVASKNPDGFLRRVVSVSDEGGTLVITTTRAALTDAIVEGSVRTSSNGSAIDGYGTAGAQSITPLTRKELSGIAIDFADKPLYEGVDDIAIGGKKARFVESIRLDHAAFSSKPAVDIDLRIKDGKVSRFVGKVEGNLDTSVSATATVTAEGDVGPAILAELRTRKHAVTRVLYQSPRIALPNFAVGGVPVSPSVQFTVTLRCEIAFGGAIVAHAGVEATSNVRLGAVYDGSGWGEPIRSDFTIKPSFTMDHGGAIDARCAIEADTELSAYGDSGITMTVAPYVDFGVKAAASGYHFRVDAGADGEMHGRADVFGIRQGDLERKLVEWKAPSLLEGNAP